MKIVINSCYGGFRLSLKGQREYLKLIDKESYFYERSRKSLETGAEEHIKIDIDADNGKHSLFTYTFTKDFGRTHGEFTIEEYKNNSFHSGDIERDDPNLIAVIEKLGSEADASCASLKIVEIPDDVKWDIEEYDGNEWVSEDHRTWS